MTPDDFAGLATPLTEADLEAAAEALGVRVQKVQAVDQVESRGRGFHPDTRRPIILYEPHIFHRLTGGKFSEAHPDLSYPTWGTRDYPASQGQRYEQLFAAMALDEAAALKACSWGRFQLMGFNHQPCGFSTVQPFVRSMVRGEGEQLRAFARFIAASPAMHAALRAGDWAGFARRYNGSGFAQHGYDQRLKVAYAALMGRALADERRQARA